MKKELLGLVVLLGVVYFFPWKSISWGKITLAPERTVTVSGYAETKISNQIANFSAGVSTIHEMKEAAVSEANMKIAEVVFGVKGLGIEEKDIQTSQMNVYQMQENVDPSMMGRGKVKLGQWSANYTLEITLRDVKKASELANLLNSSGATNVYGPNFSLDASSRSGDKLIGEAVADSRIKAEAVAVAGGAKLGKLISVSEGGPSNPGIYSMMAKSAVDSSISAPMEIGSTSVSKTVSVVWGLE